MIEAVNVSKSFEDIKAVDQISAKVTDSMVFGLIGTNGAGKSTFLRMLCGILKPDEGQILIDGRQVYENEQVKAEIFYISDDQYFFQNSTPQDLKQYYERMYCNFDEKRFTDLLQKFDLNKNRKIQTFSKGMKKQLSIISGICARTKYLLCDETFDGLDPVMRQAVKSIFAEEIDERNMTPVIASHNLRELEDICDHVGLLHRGGILLSKDLEDLKCNLHKIQCVFKEQEDETNIITQLSPVKIEKRGSLVTMTIRGEREVLADAFIQKQPLFYEMLPLSLEEIFISETEVAGYDIKSLIF